MTSVYVTGKKKGEIKDEIKCEMILLIHNFYWASL